MTDTRTLESAEAIILRHSSRGMTKLRPYLDENYCKNAARQILSLPSGVIFLITGFYVAGHAETDGPPGTLVLAKALHKLGYQPVIVTDEYCHGFFDLDGILVEQMPLDTRAEDCQRLLKQYEPKALISIERCGRNQNNDYANMRGVSIEANTAKLDLLFDLVRQSGIPTFGVGDGGNEIGMGNLQKEIRDSLALSPCIVPVDHLVIATVSNWGAYAITAYLQRYSRIYLLPSFEEVSDYLKKIVSLGSVDGVSKKQTASVDGFDLSIEKEIIDDLHRLVD